MHTLSDDQRETLRDVIGRNCAQIVWDINAVYFVFPDRATKVEAVADSPLPEDSLQEVMHLNVEVLRPAPVFTLPAEEGYWYRVLGQDLTVERLELVRTAVVLPGESLVLPASAPDFAFVVDCGVLVYTQHGVLPAVQLDDSFGFHSWSSEPPRWYSRDEVLRKLGGAYELVPVAAD